MKELTRNQQSAKAKRKFTSRAVGVLVGWAVDRAMRTRTAEKSTKRIDRAISTAESRSVSKLRKMQRNAMKNVPLLTSGIAAIAIGVGLLAAAGLRHAE